MKKTFIFMLAILIILPFSLHAASISGVTTQGQGKYSIGLDFDWVFKRDMELDSADALFPNEDLKDTEIGSHYLVSGKASFGIADNVDIYIKLGIADYEFDTEVTQDGVQIGKGNVDADTAFAYGIGVKGAFPLQDDLVIGADIQYVRHDNDIDASGTGGGITVEVTGDSQVTAWHIAPFIAKKMENMVPYIGVKYSDLKVDFSNTSFGGGEIKAKDKLGVFLGSDFIVDENTVVNIELRFLDETALTLSCSYSF